MLLLLDSSVLFRLIYKPAPIANATRQAILNPRNRLLVSYASLWEALAKVYRGSILADQYTLESELELICELGAEFLPIEEEDILATIALPDFHRDPFDRMLVAQALRMNATIVSSDRELHQYGVAVMPL